jgi:molybdopterin converting factor small subunit
VADTGAVTVEAISWVTKFVGGDGHGQKVIEVPVGPGATVRSVLAAVSGRHPELGQALWNGRELGEHMEVLVNDAVLGITHEIDSPVAPGDRIALLPQFVGGG